MDKKSLRQKAKAERQKLTQEEIEDKSLAIANQLLRMDIWDKLYYHLFLTIEEQKEINTEYILQILAGKDKEIIVSKSDFSTLEMTHYLLTDNTKFKKNEYNIPEPIDGIEVPVSKIDVVFVPLLAADKQGYRVGYGKGFYDKFLSNTSTNTVLVGISYFEPIDAISDVNEFDIPLDLLITPNSIHEFQ